MKRAILIVLIAAAVLIIYFTRLPPPLVEQTPLAPDAPAATPEFVISEINDPRGTAADDVRILHEMVANFLAAVKEPYRPPLGINEDFAKAFTGGNRYGDIFLATNHPALNEHGQLIDRWGTPYHFHPRAADAIDVRSAGPDRKLFTEDDVMKNKN